MQEGMFTRSEAKAIGSRNAYAGPVSLTLLHSMECKACPLNTARVTTPKIQPEGVENPLVYILGESPTSDDDRTGGHFMDEAGRELLRQLPGSLNGLLRWNTVVRTTPGNRVPNEIEIECCRPSIVRDIEKSKPRAIFGFGPIALQWALGVTQVHAWRGRRVPIRIGSHECWFFPFYHPSYVTHDDRDKDKLGNEYNRVFAYDLQRATHWITKEYKPPLVIGTDSLMEGVQLLTAKAGDTTRCLAVIAETFARWRKQKQPINNDIETRGLRPYKTVNTILTAAFSNFDETIAFPLFHSSAKWSEAEMMELLGLITDLLNDPEVPKEVHNARFELEWWYTILKRNGFTFNPYASKWHCTQTQAYVIDERIGSQGLDDLAIMHFGLPLKQASAGLDKANLDSAPLEKVLKYNAFDAKYSRAVGVSQEQEIIEEGLLECYEMSIERIPTLVISQNRGVPVDGPRVQQLLSDSDAKRRPILDAIYSLPVVRDCRTQTGAFNPDSPQQLITVFRDMLKRPEGAKKGGGYSTDDEALSKMSDEPLAKLILDLRELNKLMGTYLTNLLPGRDSDVWEDGKLHTSFNQTVTDTGRLSSTDPNMQNFPKRTNAWVRQVIIPHPGCVVLAADYGQLEYRGIGTLSNDKRIIQSLLEDFDVHLDWTLRIAAEIPEVRHRFGDTLKKAGRSEFKNTWVFPIFYGASCDSVVRKNRFPETIGRKLYDQFKAEFNGVSTWQEKLIRQYRETMYVEMPTGRRRRAPMTKQMVINAPVQGSCSDIVIDGMNRLGRRAWNEQKPYLHPELNIHDDLTFFSVPKAKLNDAIEVVVTDMLSCRFPWLKVPLMVEVSVGPNWHAMKEIGKFASNKL